ncbi:TonB-dependent receptor plug domain-containing protein, partial [Prevotella pallens]
MKKETIYLSLAMLAMATTPCNAQSEEIKDSTQHLEEVIISTTRIPEIKQNAAATVTILDQKQIAEMSKAAPDITHLLGMLTPGMALSSNTTSSRSQSLRGRSALILIDGIPQSTPLRSTDRDIRTIDIAAIDHIEVVKGSTALYGNGAIGGLINIITKK